VETGQFIHHRLHVAGGHSSLFTAKACALVHRLTKGNPRLINQVCDLSLTHGYAMQARVITSKLVAQASFERSKGKILPLSSREDLTVLANVPDDAGEFDAASQQPATLQASAPQWGESPLPARPSLPSVAPEPFFYAKGVAMRKEGRHQEAIEMLELAGKHPSYRVKAQVQIGLCHRASGEHRTAIAMFRAALKDQAATRTEVIDIQYFLARTLESVGEIAEAESLYRRLVETNPHYKDAAYRANELSSRLRQQTNGGRRSEDAESWIGTAIKSFPRWPLPANRKSLFFNSISDFKS
jgi:tetratricopeptide (TPR) repeat protein